MVLALELLHAACSLNGPLDVGASVALLLDESVTFRPQTSKHRWPPLNAKAIGIQRGVYEFYRVEGVAAADLEAWQCLSFQLFSI